MPATQSHNKTKDKHFQIVIVPEGESGEKRTFHATPMLLGSAIFGIVVIIAAIVVLLLGYTPLGALVPISNAEMERRYGKELVTLQEQLTKLTEDFTVVRDYNLKLRAALGQNVAGADASTFNKGQKESAPEKNASSQADQQDETDQPFAESRQVGEMQNQEGVAPQSGFQQYAMPRQEMNASFHAAFPISPPVLGYITRGFNEAKNHFGIDYAGKRGTVISAAADGYVVFAGWTYSDGNMIIISHGSGFFTIYKHNQSLLKSANEFVKRGEPIALLGNSGQTSYGPHLHFELWKDGQPQNPEEYLLAAESL
jgi:murein DD-endopeptidase MepM/ murein hydrolase activator NlpD